MPATGAEYYALLSRALPGTPLHVLRWQVSLHEARALIHASGILEGGSYIWPDPELSSRGRAMLRVRETLRRVRAGEWEVDL
ncbi:MAG TPA: hypothetical protein PK490_12185 [Prosthecobacter sp.]|nr:hypothetical protein [Prosthecobacter sp.]HRK15045.1 hypothetical protein [Prosthecobacter sp.]